MITQSDTEQTDEAITPRRAFFVRFAGASCLIITAPLVAAALVLAFIGSPNPVSLIVYDIFRALSVAILGFVGGIRFGVKTMAIPTTDEAAGDVRKNKGVRELLLAPLPLMLGVVFLLLEPKLSIALLLVTHCAQGAWDSVSISKGAMPSFLAPIRIVQTVILALCHFVVFFTL